MIEVQEIFHVKYGVNLELNKLEQDPDGINFVSRTAKNNGVSARVRLLDNVEPIPAGVLTVAGGGSVLETFLQPKDFYSGRDLYYLKPKIELSDNQKLYYCSCIRANKYKYSYGRQANRTLKKILIPEVDAIPDWVAEVSLQEFDDADKPFKSIEVSLCDDAWVYFRFDDLFSIERGKGPRKKDLDGIGGVPVITSSDSNNGLSGFTSAAAMHDKNTIGVNRNGSVAEAFFHHYPFCSTEDVHIFSPKFDGMNQYVAMFLITLIKKEKYRYSYGRKWGIERMKNSTIKLPVTGSGDLDLVYMERFIKSLAFSSKI